MGESSWRFSSGCCWWLWLLIVALLQLTIQNLVHAECTGSGVSIMVKDVKPIVGTSSLVITCSTPQPLTNDCLSYGIKLLKSSEEIAGYAVTSCSLISTSYKTRATVTCTGNQKMTLVIDKVRKEDDDANWQCSFLNKNSKKMAVTTQYPPESVVLSVNKANPFKEADTILFTCAANNGIPASYMYEWIYGDPGTPLGGETSRTLKITNLTRKNAGIYQCIARNTVGSRSSQTKELIIHYKPTVKFVKPLELKIKVGNFGVAMVTFEAYPDVTAVTCVFKIGKTDHAPISEKENSDTWLIKFQIANNTNYGIYDCVATNDVGSVYFDISIKDPGTGAETGPGTEPGTEPGAGAGDTGNKIGVASLSPAIIGIIVGSVAFCILLLVLIILCVRRWRTLKSKKAGQQNDKYASNRLEGDGAPQNGGLTDGSEYERINAKYPQPTIPDSTYSNVGFDSNNQEQSYGDDGTVYADIGVLAPHRRGQQQVLGDTNDADYGCVDFNRPVPNKAKLDRDLEREHSVRKSARLSGTYV